MEGNLGQQYVVNVFGRGIAQDISFDLPIGQVRDTYIRANKMAVSHDKINAVKAINGDEEVSTIQGGVSGHALLLGYYEMSGYIYSFWAYSASSFIRVYRDSTNIGESIYFPGSYSNIYLYIDGNPNSGELAITDGVQIPIILDMDDMYNKTVVGGAATYTTDYDQTLYEVNQDINLTQPQFRRLNNVGVGGGVLPGSYSYSYRLVSANGDETLWSPPTPFIPVPSSYGSGGEPTFVPGAKTYGEAASLNPTKYGIDIAFRVINYSGFDYVEIKRIPNNVGAPVDYTTTPQYVRLETAISETIITVVNFTDLANINWATLDDSDVVSNSIISTARTVRFYDNRLILGGVTYESRMLDNSIVSSVTGGMFKEDIGSAGYTDIMNQVYKKSQRLGERYGYAVQGIDAAVSRSFAVPIVNQPSYNLSDYKFPERRESYTGDYAVEAALVDSDTALSTGDCNEVYTSGSDTKDEARLINIVEGIDSDGDGTNEIYRPLHPTQREDSDDSDLGRRTCDIVEGSAPGVGTSYIPTGYGHNIIATGMRINNIDEGDFPDWCKGLSILRSDPAGRVLAQGIGMYAMTPGQSGTSGADLVAHKALDKLWIYSPELDSVIGNNPGLLADIAANPEDYEIQLVSPVGFFPEFYSGVADYEGLGYSAGIDMALIATEFYTSDHINPFDTDILTGRGDGYATFGRWRNQSAQGNGIDYSNNAHVFGITDASIASVINPNFGNDMSGRSSYLEVTLDGNIYSSTDVGGGSQSTSRDDHEPFYVVNIIRSGVHVSNNNADQFKEIGHYIKFNSQIGIGSGKLNQSLEIISERRVDYHWEQGSGGVYLTPNASDEYSYIWVNGERWLNVTYWHDTDIDAIRAALPYGSFTQTSNGGDSCETSYGIYTVDVVDGVDYVTFPYQTDETTPVDITPEDGDIIEVRYDNTKPIDILLGDTVIGPASFVPIDCEVNLNIDAYRRMFKLSRVFPFDTFQFKYDFVETAPVYHTPYDVSGIVVGSTKYESGADVSIDYVRQMLVMFMCESTVNLPFVYKDFFPYKNYVMRPLIYDAKSESESELAYIRDLNIYEDYVDDYPEEYLNWQYGGFHFPEGYNFDYSKQHTDIYTELPVGITEVLEFPKRVQWGAKRSTSTISLGVSTVFPVTNIYDILLKDASEINILYDQYSGKGGNLYTIMDRGVVGLLTDKSVLRDGVGDDLGIILSDAGFIRGEVIVDPFVGCPDKRWRGRAEGSIKNQQGIQLPGLAFHGEEDIYLLSGNAVASIGTNYRETIVPLVKAIEDGDVLASMIEQSRNELWAIIDGVIHIYSFTVNNWVAHIDDTNLSGLAFLKQYDGDHMVRVGLINEFIEQPAIFVTSIIKSNTGVELTSGSTTPYIDIAVTPNSFGQSEFTDLFIASDIIPYTVTVSVEPSFSYGSSNSYSVLHTGIKNINGLYRVTLGRTTAGDVLIGNTLYVHVVFVSDDDVTINYLKTGYKKVSGS